MLEGYQFRNICEEDINKVLKWRNSDRIRACMFTDDIITEEQHLTWFQKVIKNDSDIIKIFLVQNRPVGVVSFTDIDKRNNKCSWGFYLGEEDLPKGTGLVMGYLGLEYAFEQMNVRKLCGQVLATNTASIKFHQKLGFSEEGRFLRHILKNNEYVDVICYAVFKDNWQNIKKEQS